MRLPCVAWTLVVVVLMECWNHEGLTMAEVDHARTRPAESRWQPVPFITAQARAAGVRLGGEGGQWPQSIDVDEVDGSLVLFVTDVGGLWRSLDGGQTFEPANVGHTPRGSSGIAIDPHFPHRVISVGSNSMGSQYNGLYLSEDRAASWRPVHRVPMAGQADRRRQIVFDPSTRDEAAKMTRLVYWSRTREVHDNLWGDLKIDPGLYRSEDGGRHWERLNEVACEIAGHSALAVHPTTGRLYVANDRGVWISDDRGQSFRQTYKGKATSIAVSKAQPEAVWFTQPQAVMRSLDAGLTWEALQTRGLEEPIVGEGGGDANPNPRSKVVFGALRVNPINPERMIMRSLADHWRWLRHVSGDGGKTWTLVKVDDLHAFFPQNARQAMFSWHPTDPDRVWSFGGDWPTLSVDGGRTFRWAGRGQNAVFVGGMFNHHPHHPELLFLSSQDYNGAVTFDGGETWRYTNVSGHGWGGFAYGGTAINLQTLAAGKADNWGSPRQLRISHDGGQVWQDVAGIIWTSNRKRADFGFDIGLVDPRDPKVAFVARLRTEDGGHNWQVMEGCSGVFTAGPGGELYGVMQTAEEAHVVVSRDHGQSWQIVTRVEGGVDDLAASPAGDHLYLASRDRLWVMELDQSDMAADRPLRPLPTPKTGTGRHRIATVCVDPKDAQTLYVGQRIDLHVADQAVLKSTDGGQTWFNLTLTEPLDGTHRDGGREPTCLRIHPVTGDLWVTTGCYGVWKYVASQP